jgi:SnoaL-like domain
MTRTNLETIFEKLIAASARKDVPTIEALLDKNVVWQGVQQEFVCHNREEVLEVLRGFMDMDFLIEHMELVNAGDRVVLSLRARGIPGSPGGRGQVFRSSLFAKGRSFASRTSRGVKMRCWRQGRARRPGARAPGSGWCRTTPAVPPAGAPAPWAGSPGTGGASRTLRARPSRGPRRGGCSR